MRLSLPTLLVAALLTVPMMAAAQVYKWTDANGTTHFTQTPPPNGTKYTSIHTAAEADQAMGTEKPKQDDSKPSDTAEDARTKQVKRFCAQLQSNIDLLKSDATVKRLGADGKTTAIDGKMRAQQLKQQQMRYDAYCKK